MGNGDLEEDVYEGVLRRHNEAELSSAEWFVGQEFGNFIQTSEGSILSCCPLPKYLVVPIDRYFYSITYPNASIFYIA